MSRKVLEILDNHITKCRHKYSHALEVYKHMKNRDYDKLKKYCPCSVYNGKFVGLCEKENEDVITREMCIECWKQFENSFEEKEGE